MALLRLRTRYTQKAGGSRLIGKGVVSLEMPNAGFSLPLGSAEMAGTGEAGLGMFLPGKRPSELHVRAKAREEHRSK